MTRIRTQAQGGPPSGGSTPEPSGDAEEASTGHFTRAPESERDAETRRAFDEWGLRMESCFIEAFGAPASPLQLRKLTEFSACFADEILEGVPLSLKGLAIIEALAIDGIRLGSFRRAVEDSDAPVAIGRDDLLRLALRVDALEHGDVEEFSGR